MTFNRDQELQKALLFLLSDCDSSDQTAKGRPYPRAHFYLGNIIFYGNQNKTPLLCCLDLLQGIYLLHPGKLTGRSVPHPTLTGHLSK